GLISERRINWLPELQHRRQRLRGQSLNPIHRPDIYSADPWFAKACAHKLPPQSLRSGEELFQPDEITDSNQISASVSKPVTVHVQHGSSGCQTNSAWFEHPRHFSNASRRIGQIAKNLDAKNEIKARIGKRNRLNVGLPNIGAGIID